jgi:uncharacterized Fe-S cluster-containing radical SAM superfamily protein
MVFMTSCRARKYFRSRYEQPLGGEASAEEVGVAEGELVMEFIIMVIMLS